LDTKLLLLAAYIIFLFVINYVFKPYINSQKKYVGCVFLLFYSIHDKTSFYLRGFQIYLSPKDFYFPARVRIWVISTVTAPNKHKSCTNCSSRTKSVVTVKMGLYIFLYIYIYYFYLLFLLKNFLSTNM